MKSHLQSSQLFYYMSIHLQYEHCTRRRLHSRWVCCFCLLLCGFSWLLGDNSYFLGSRIDDLMPLVLLSSSLSNWLFSCLPCTKTQTNKTLWCSSYRQWSQTGPVHFCRQSCIRLQSSQRCSWACFSWSPDTTQTACLFGLTWRG